LSYFVLGWRVITGADPGFQDRGRT
jgi:hypothetical protein